MSLGWWICDEGFGMVLGWLGMLSQQLKYDFIVCNIQQK